MSRDNVLPCLVIGMARATVNQFYIHVIVECFQGFLELPSLVALDYFWRSMLYINTSQFTCNYLA